MTAPAPATDPVAVRTFLAMVHGVAANALKGADRPGVLQLVRIHPADESVLTRRYPIGDVDTMTAHAVMDAEAGFNLYVEGRTVSETASGRGKAADTRGVFAFVSDADADKGRAGSLGVQPSFVVETSPGNEHQWLALDRALTAEQAQPIGAAIRAAAGSDGDTGVITQPYRVAGTPNYPGRKKLARGRVATPTRLLEHTGKVWTADELRAAFPAVEKPSAHSAGPHQTGTSGRTSNRVVRIVAEEGDDRSARFHAAVQAALADGLTIDDLEELMRQHPTGCAGKYLEPSDRLRREIERSWDKAEAHAAEVRRAAEKPAFEDAAQPVALARQAVETRVQAFIEAANAWRLAGDEEAEPPVHAVAVSTGVGKTRITARTLADYIISRRTDRRPAKPILYVVPRHRLGDEIAAQFDGYGITAKVFRGREADDPTSPGQTMCDDVEAVKIALSLGESVQKACCRNKDTKSGITHHCPFYSTCSYQAQMREKPEVWIVAHQMLFQGQTALGKVEMVVVDESFWQTGVRIPNTGLTLDEVAAFLPFGSPKSDTLLNDIESYRRRLARALRLQDGPGGVLRANLVEANLTPETCSTAISLEWRLKDKAPIYPGMPAAERRLAARVAAKTKHVRSFVALWKAARDVLNDEGLTASGRLYLDTRDDPDGRVLVAKARSVKAVAKQWRRPTLLLDATLPPAEILSAFYPNVETADPIEAAMPHVRVRQVLDAPVSATKLKLDDDGAPRRNLRAVRRTVLRRFIDNGRAPLLVIAQKAVAGWLRASGLPDGIGVEHFNNVAGLDQYRDVRGLMVIGRALPQPAAVEALAGALTGRQPAVNEGRYPYVGRGIRTSDGSPRGVECAAHPDPAAEACRWQITEGELMQALGRARGVNRAADTPLSIDLIANVVLPMAVDEVQPWNPPDEEVEMLIEGIVLDSGADISTVWPEIWPTPEAARKWLSRRPAPPSHSVTDPYINTFSIGIRHAVERFRYQQPGARQKWRTGAYDTAVVPDPRGWLEARLGPLAKFEIVSAEPAAQPAPAAPLRSADIDPDLAARFRCGVDLPAGPRPVPVKAEVVRWRLPSDDEPIRWPPAIAAILATAAPASVYREAAE